MQTLAFSRLPPQQLVLVLALWPLLPELETALLTTSASLSGPSSAPRGGRASWNPGEGPRHAAEVLGVCPGPLTRPRHWACARAPSPGQGARRVPGRPLTRPGRSACAGAPPHPAGALGVCPGPPSPGWGAQCARAPHLAVEACVALRAGARVGAVAVVAGAAVQAGPRVTLVDVMLAVAAREARWTQAGEGVDAIHAGTAVEAGAGGGQAARGW